MADPADPPVWFVRTGGVEKGPVTGAALRGLAASGRVSEASAVRKAGGPWRPAAEVKGLLSPAGPATPPPPAPAPEPPAPDPPPPPVEFAAAPAPDPPGPPPVAEEFIDPAEVALALDDAPASVRPARRSSAEYGELRGYGASFAVLGTIAYVLTGVLILSGLALIGLAVWGVAVEEPAVLSAAVFGVGALAYSIPVGIVGVLLRCLGKGVEAFADIAGNVAALRG